MVKKGEVVLDGKQVGRKVVEKDVMISGHIAQKKELYPSVYVAICIDLHTSIKYDKKKSENVAKEM